VLTAVVGIHGDAQFVCLVLPNSTAWGIIVIIDGVIEVHDTLLGVPIQAIGQLHPIRSQKLQCNERHWVARISEAHSTRCGSPT